MMTSVNHTRQGVLCPEQLAQARNLAGATLRDGTKLSEDNWEAEFEEWRKKQEEQAGDD